MMLQQYILFVTAISMSLFIVIQMCSIQNNPDDFQRFQRGFGNRRNIFNGLKQQHSLKGHLFIPNGQDSSQADRYLFSNPFYRIEQNNLAQQREQQLPIMYR